VKCCDSKINDILLVGKNFEGEFDLMGEISAFFNEYKLSNKIINMEEEFLQENNS
jgi:hypothetical protein